MNLGGLEHALFACLGRENDEYELSISSKISFACRKKEDIYMWALQLTTNFADASTHGIIRQSYHPSRCKTDVIEMMNRNPNASNMGITNANPF